MSNLGAVKPLEASDHLAAPPSAEDQQEALRIEGIRQEADARFAVIDQARAQGANIPYNVWQHFDEDTKQKIASTVTVNQRNEAVLAQGQMTPMSRQSAHMLPEFDLSTAMAGLRSPEDFAAYARTLLREEHFDVKHQAAFVPMCDPYVEINVNGEPARYHPDISLIPVKAVGQKTQQGFTSYPVYPFLPRPEILCQITDAAVYGLGAKPCTYKGRTEDEVELHMQTAHPMEYRSRLRRLEREKAEGDERQRRDDQAAMRLLLQRALPAKEDASDATS